MKIDVNQVLLNSEGKPRKNFTQKVGADGLPTSDLEVKGDLTLKDVLIAAVNSLYKGEESLAPEQIYERGKLTRRLRHGGERSFSATEVQLICGLVAKRYNGDPEFVLQVTELLDPDNKALQDAPEVVAA